MRIHVQSPIQYVVVKRHDEELLIQAERHKHYAVGTVCPRCDARGGPCIEAGRHMPPLEVHMERAEAAVSSL